MKVEVFDAEGRNIEDTGEADWEYPIWQTRHYIDVLLTYDTAAT